MRKEHSKHPRSVRARHSGKKEISTAGVSTTLFDKTNTAAREQKVPVFRINAIEILMPEIDVMAGEIQRLSGSRTASAEEVQSLRSFFSQLCLFANDLENSTAFPDCTGPKLSAQDLELENMVRMLRNDLDQIAMRTCA